MNDSLGTGLEGRASARPVVQKHDPPCKVEFVITGLIVSCACSDGKIRSVRINSQQANKIKNFVQYTCGGRLPLYKHPIKLVPDGNRMRRLLHSLGMKGKTQS